MALSPHRAKEVDFRTERQRFHETSTKVHGGPQRVEALQLPPAHVGHVGIFGKSGIMVNALPGLAMLETCDGGRVDGVERTGDASDATRDCTKRTDAATLQKFLSASRLSIQNAASCDRKRISPVREFVHRSRFPTLAISIFARARSRAASSSSSSYSSSLSFSGNTVQARVSSSKRRARTLMSAFSARLFCRSTSAGRRATLKSLHEPDAS